MSTSKVKSDRASRIKEIQQQLGEREDRLHSEYVRERILRLAAEREAKKQPQVKSPKTVKKSPK